MNKTLTLKNVVAQAFCLSAGTIMLLMFMMAWITPEKTPSGMYTQPFKYWLDADYFNENFNQPTKGHN